MRQHRYGIVLFVLGFAGLLIEVAYTRLLSYKVYYYFTYFVIALALLGIGSGGVTVAASSRLRALSLHRLLSVGLPTTGLVVAVGYVSVATAEFNASEFVRSLNNVTQANVVGLMLVVFPIFAAFWLIGVLISAVFAQRPDDIGRLYCFDLAGAAMGAMISAPLLTAWPPATAIFIAGALMTLAGIRFAWARSAAFAACASLVAVGQLAIAYRTDILPHVLPDSGKIMRNFAVDGKSHLFSKWHPLFRVDLFLVESVNGSDNFRLICHDGQLGSTLQRFDGDPASLSRFDADSRLFPFAAAPPNPRVLIIGAAGGHEVLASLHFGAEHIDAVELNPVTVSLVREHFSDYVGHFDERPDVNYVNAEGRAFIERAEEKYDLIYFVAPDSYAAMNAASAGGFVLAESYLFTVEMIRKCLDRLSPNGILCAQFGEPDYDPYPNRVLRLLSTARVAFRKNNLDSFEENVIVVTSPGVFDSATILLRKEAFTPDELHTFTEHIQSVPESNVRYLGTQLQAPGPVTDMITLPTDDLPSWIDDYAFDVAPVEDNQPFFWHFTRFRDVLGGASRFDVQGRRGRLDGGTGEFALVVITGFAIAYAATVLFLPLLLVRRQWHKLPHKRTCFLYFGAIGFGFMCYEITLIQRFTLLLGFPTYSLVVSLATMLVCAGLGSLASIRYPQKFEGIIWAALGALALLTLYYIFISDSVIDATISWPLAMRVLITILSIAPLGFVLGAFMPLGMRVVASLDHQDGQYVAWGWAVNGFFSVVGSLVGTMLTMTFGFNFVLAIAFAVYVLGTVPITRGTMRRAAPSAAS